MAWRNVNRSTHDTSRFWLCSRSPIGVACIFRTVLVSNLWHNLAVAVGYLWHQHANVISTKWHDHRSRRTSNFLRSDSRIHNISGCLTRSTSAKFDFIKTLWKHLISKKNLKQNAFLNSENDQTKDIQKSCLILLQIPVLPLYRLAPYCIPWAIDSPSSSSV